jgi:hypothetical protein
MKPTTIPPGPEPTDQDQYKIEEDETTTRRPRQTTTPTTMPEMTNYTEVYHAVNHFKGRTSQRSSSGTWSATTSVTHHPTMRTKFPSPK